jgi:hypothetical protein
MAGQKRATGKKPVVRTVGSEIRRLFPHGTNGAKVPSWSNPPFFPQDIFAAAAYLLEASGAYCFIVAPFVPTRGNPNVSYSKATRSPSPLEVDRWRRIGKQWAKDRATLEKSIYPIWKKLWAERDANFHKRAFASWWRHAHALLVISDEASTDMGYISFSNIDETPTWANSFTSYLMNSVTQRWVIQSTTGRHDDCHYGRHVALDSICIDVDRDVVRVLPKGKTAEIGCTLRTLSHNLTLLPPRGYTDTYWHQQIWNVEAPDETRLNVLLIPFPYNIPTGSFKGDRSNDSTGISWGRFRVEQKWLQPNPEAEPSKSGCWSTDLSRASFIKFVDTLIEKSSLKKTAIQGIALPEYALDWDTYDELVRHVRDNRPSVEFIISGVSKDCSENLGNQVVFTVFKPQDGVKPQDGLRIAETHSRAKHHRWRLDEQQIRGYGLQRDLNPSHVWWEFLEIEDRVVHVDVFRSRSAFTAVICEDLARADPVVSQIRSLGPNLIFALLLDGPQRKGRWSGLYASNLADDPGSSVLTVTSLGLINRLNARTEPDDPRRSRSIALWKNRSDGSAFSSPKTDFVELELEDDAVAIVVKLRSSPSLDVTLDGRIDRDTTAWYYEDRSQVKLSCQEIVSAGWSWIVGSPP